MNICIFGGAFDPVHNGHIKIALSALKQFNIDKLIFMVSKEPPHKSSHKASFIHRYNMVKLVTDEYEFFDVTDIENRSETLSYTYNSLQEIRKIYYNDNIYFLVGSDIFATIKSWHKYNELFDFTTFIVGYRPGISFQNMMKQLPLDIVKKIDEHNKIELFELNDAVNISSSFIRDNIDISHKYLPEKVYEYIKKNKLYKNEV